MDRLLNTKASSERASRRKKRGEALVDQLVDLELIKKTKNEDGFLIQGNNLIPELKSVYIEAPAGLITVFGTYDGMQVYEADHYNGAVYSYGLLSTYDYVSKRYYDTGFGLDSWHSILIQGQKEADILIAAPYSNMVASQFVRNGSFYNTVPIGNIFEPSYQYPDSWPKAGVFPHISEQAWLSIAGTDLLYNNTINANIHHEVVKSGHLSKNSSLGGRTMFSDQLVSFWRPTATAFPLPVSAGYREVRPVRFIEYPFDNSIRYFGTIVEELEGVLTYDRLSLESILPDIADPPETHTGPLMPTELRNIILSDPVCSARPSGAFVAFSGIDERPTIFTIIDFTATEQLKYQTAPPGSNSADQDFFFDDDNIEDRKWRISCHWYNMETGETWSFTADQFWDLLRDRVRNLSIAADWRTASSSSTVDADWHAALATLWQWFGRPNHDFQVPHDTWTFPAENDEIYTWSRYYGNIKIDRDGIHGLEPADVLVPQIVTDTDGVRPTIRYSGLFGEDEDAGEEGQHRYICVCEKLERAFPDEDLPQGQKEIKGIFVGTPFVEEGWIEVPMLQITPIEGRTWSLVHVRIVFHNMALIENLEGNNLIDHVMLLGVARERYIDEETEAEVINYYPCNIDYNTNSGGQWKLAPRYPSLNTLDPVFGERFSVEMSLYGDSVLSLEMMKYLSHPAAMSQAPFGPYDGYYSGLP